MRFEAVIRQSGKSATGIAIPPEILESLGGGTRPTVTITVNGFAYTTALGVMGGTAMAPLSAERRAAARVAAGDAVEVDVVLSEAVREVQIPADLLTALAGEPAAAAFLDGLAYSHRKEWARWIEDAKKPETRAARVGAAVEKLRAGQQRH